MKRGVKDHKTETLVQLDLAMETFPAPEPQVHPQDMQSIMENERPNRPERTSWRNPEAPPITRLPIIQVPIIPCIKHSCCNLNRLCLVMLAMVGPRGRAGSEQELLC